MTGPFLPLLFSISAASCTHLQSFTRELLTPLPSFLGVSSLLFLATDFGGNQLKKKNPDRFFSAISSELQLG